MDSRKNLKEIFHPYVFVLKEGERIKDNYLDYSLMILQLTAPETIRSPLKRVHAIPSQSLPSPTSLAPP
jgi:hypothetical protein